MAKKKYEEANIQAIAETIRSKTGTDTIYDTSEMSSGVNEVYDKGRTDENKAFWDKFFMNDVPSERASLFAGRGWNDQSFRPDRDINCYKATANNMFALATFTDLEALLKECNINIDFKNIYRFDNMFYYCAYMTVCPEIDFTNVNTGNIDSVWSNCPSLHTIRKAIMPTDKSLRMSNTFLNNSSLVNIEFEGLITQSPNFSYSPLSVESMKSIISHLNNYAGTSNEYAYTLTLSSASKTLLEAEGATSPNGNTWSQYIDDLGWTLL